MHEYAINYRKRFFCKFAKGILLFMNLLVEFVIHIKPSTVINDTRQILGQYITVFLSGAHCAYDDFAPSIGFYFATILQIRIKQHVVLSVYRVKPLTKSKIAMPI